MAAEEYGGRLTTTASIPIVRAQPLPVPPIPERIRISANTITLDQVRTGPRPTNDYVDNPTNTRPAVPPRGPGTLVRNNVHTPVPTGERQPMLVDRQPIVFQPVPAGGLKPPSTQISTRTDVDTAKHHVTDNDETHLPSESIICHKCGKCKCQQCTQRRELPSRWICNNKFNCSATEIVETCTCLCMVRGIFYHCCKNNEGDCGDDCVSDDPCACCERPSCCKRWSCLGLLTLCLPCLACYWPMRCGVCACTTCYNLCTRRGCHCSSKSVSGQNGKRFLLVESESSSA